MAQSKHFFTRAVKVAAAFLISLGTLVPILMNGSAAAAGTISSRSIKIDNSAGAATSVGYTITFTMASSGASVGGVVVMFCNAATSPIPGAACTAPAGFDSKTSTVLGTVTGTGFTGMTKDTTGAGSGALANVFQITQAAPQTATGTPTVVIPVTLVVNPTAANTTFYARIIVYDTQAHSQSSTATVLTGAVDQGGVAMSTGYTINITATVQEQLTFCVSGSGPLSDCAAPTAPTLTLGHSSPAIVDSSAVDSVPAYMYMTTNAAGSVIIRMRTNTTNYHTLYNANHSFTVANAGSASNPGAAQAPGTEFFGMEMSACSSACTASAPYSGGAGYYGLDTTTANNNVTTGFGSPVATVTATAGTAMTATFGASASTTTPAGVYTAKQDMIATGTY
jgi:hypothetical protein